MTRPDPRLARLTQLADLLHNRESARTAQKRAACSATEARLAQLASAAPWSDDPALFRARQAHLLWAQAERARLNRRLALQKAALADQTAQAARALGRAQVLAKLAQKPKVRP